MKESISSQNGKMPVEQTQPQQETQMFLIPAPVLQLTVDTLLDNMPGRKSFQLLTILSQLEKVD